MLNYSRFLMTEDQSKTDETNLIEPNRREFIKGASIGSLMMLMGGVPLNAADAPEEPLKDTGFSTQGATVKCGVIGLGIWGREVVQTLALMPNAPVVAICDNYKPFLNRTKDNLAPKAEAFEDYKKLLESKEVQAVIIATPTHLHRQIVEDALKAGKHVYCEMPLAHTIEDARAIAKAASEAVKLNFQSGLQLRSDPQKIYALAFVHNGALGQAVMARSQWHKKTSWRNTSNNPAREKIINWRLDKALSLGLVGELGIHQIDLVSWFIRKQPESVGGFGSILKWDDEREVADTVQAVFRYPGKFNHFFDATLANSFEASYDVFYGTDSAIAIRGSKNWWFKEADAPLLGWEIYANKQKFGDEAGISLSADASKSVQAGKAEVSPYQDSTLHWALKSFLKNSDIVETGVKNFHDLYGDDAEGLKDNMDKLPKAHAAGYKEGFEATVLAIKANEAVVGGKTIKLTPELFAI